MVGAMNIPVRETKLENETFEVEHYQQDSDDLVTLLEMLEKRTRELFK